MNKRIACFICLIVLAGASVASAQMTGGVKAGINIANMTFSGSGVSVTTGNRTGFLGGAFVELPVAPNVFVQPEVLIVMKGTDVSDIVSEFGGATGKVKTNYLDIPILVRFNVPTTSEIMPFVYGGPNIGFILSAKASGGVSGTTADEDIKSDFRSVDFGIAIGGGVQFGRVTGEVRFTQGLTNALTDTASDNGAVKVKNRGIAFMVGYRF